MELVDEEARRPVIILSVWAPSAECEIGLETADDPLLQGWNVAAALKERGGAAEGNRRMTG